MHEQYKKIKQLIADDQLEEALAEMLAYFDRKDIISQSAKLKYLAKHVTSGTIKFEDEVIERNKIRESLINILSDIKTEYSRSDGRGIRNKLLVFYYKNFTKNNKITITVFIIFIFFRENIRPVILSTCMVILLLLGYKLSVVDNKIVIDKKPDNRLSITNKKLRKTFEKDDSTELIDTINLLDDISVISDTDQSKIKTLIDANQTLGHQVKEIVGNDTTNKDTQSLGPEIVGYDRDPFLSPDSTGQNSNSGDSINAPPDVKDKERNKPPILKPKTRKLRFNRNVEVVVIGIRHKQIQQGKLRILIDNYVNDQKVDKVKGENYISIVKIAVNEFSGRHILSLVSLHDGKTIYRMPIMFYDNQVNYFYKIRL